jgi:Asp/Glu/hydantoin racemase
MKNNKKLIVVIHTSLVSMEDLKTLFSKLIPEAKVHHIVDDSLLAGVMANGGVTPFIIRRVCAYAQFAEEMGADLIFNQCSSVGEAINVARNLVSVPITKVDEPMAQKAVALGKRIAVIATVASTMKPSVGLVYEAANKAGKKVEVIECLVDGALDVLMKEGNKEKHNQLVLKEINRVSKECDVIVLAQGSMMVLLPHLKDIPVPVLTSPELGVRRAADILHKM